MNHKDNLYYIVAWITGIVFSILIEYCVLYIDGRPLDIVAGIVIAYLFKSMIYHSFTHDIPSN